MIRRATVADAAALARLHAEALPSSMLSALGSGALARYYAFVAASDRESVWVADAGAITGGCVLSDEPAGVLRRFAGHAPLALVRDAARSLANRGVRARLSQRLREATGQRGDEAHAPEVTQIFTDATRRGQGIGASLLRTCEAALRQRGAQKYFVHTERDDNEAGIRFYRREGFVTIGESRSFGTAFLVMQKDLD